MNWRCLAGLALCGVLAGCNPISADQRVGQWKLDKPVEVPGSSMGKAYVYLDISWQNSGMGTRNYQLDQTVRVPATADQPSNANWRQMATLITARGEDGKERQWWQFGRAFPMLRGDHGTLCESGNKCPLRLTEDGQHLEGTLLIFDTPVSMRLTRIDALRRQ
ncbi:hypothetical protein [Carnimonas bestiolae]|uniref:hypothetical protein n=1 Tax=Carnimonas bestiolae TaxID=3402172 RepID=UPI003EDC9A96